MADSAVTCPPYDSQDTKPKTFEVVLQHELECIASSRRHRGVEADAHKDNLIGLAFSGGGIRSATFNLGVLQALARQCLLHKIDYLSTVSGGGYIGSWLAAFTKRQQQGDQKFEPIEDALSGGTYEIGQSAENTSIHWLRNYVDYLTPRMGVLSGDWGAALGTYLRNVSLNLIILLLFLLGATLLPDFIVLFTRDEVCRKYGIFFLFGSVLLVLATLFMGMSMVDFRSWERHRSQTWFYRNEVQLRVIAPYFTCALFINSSMWAWKEMTQTPWWWWVAGGAVFYTTIWGLTFLFAGRRFEGSDGFRHLVSPGWLVLSGVGAGGLGGLLFYGYAQFVATIPATASNTWMVVIFGTVALMLLMQFVAVIQLGLLGADCMDLIREWWARAGGRLIQLMACWILIFGVVVFGPLGIRWLWNLDITALAGAVLGWLLSSWGGILAAKSPKTGGEIKSTPAVLKAVSETKSTSWLTSPTVLEAVAKVIPYVFAVGLLILLSTAVQIIVGLSFATARQGTIELWWSRHLPGDVLWNLFWTVHSKAEWHLLLISALVLIASAWILSKRVDINDFSMHHFYRNRLVRAYLGASRMKERKPQPFTGFDPRDDVSLKEFDLNYSGPYPILNAALNVTSGGELGFQERKAKSFMFTPRYCGYDLAAKDVADSAESTGSYLPTRLGRCKKLGSEQGISLGTAMAISGAAASPNMGHYTSAAAAFFMTLFDVRLGWWMGNPRYPEKWRSSGPSPALAYLMKELVAQSDEASSYVYLSDGGHFENLAVYELVKRRCRVIVACDSGADRSYLCGDLVGAIQKCRADFGVDIRISVSEIKPASNQCTSLRNFALGEIVYGPGDVGALIYIKSSLPTDDVNAPLESRLAAGVLSYADAHSDFPHQSTADQWFNEVQFEAYRALGEYIATNAAPYIETAINDAWNQPQRAHTAAGKTT